MTDLADELGKLVREQQAREAELEELAEQARAGQDTAELERRLGVESSVARAAFEPLSEQAQARWTAAIQGSWAGSAAQPGGVTAPVDTLARRRVGPIWLAPLMAAAALMMFWFWPSTLPLLEPYELEVSGAVAQERAVPRAGTPLGLVAGSSLELLLRPEHAPDRELTARVFLRSTAEELPLPASIERAASGTLRVRVQLGSSLPAAGELVVLVGLPGLVENAQSAARLLASKVPSGPGWQRVVRPFTRHAAAP